MDLYHIDRRMASPGRPALEGHTSVVPAIYVFPLPDGETVEVSCYLPAGANNFACYSRELYISDLQDFFERYRDNPELTLKAVFSWDAEESASRINVRKATGRQIPIAPKGPNIYNQADLI